MANTRNRTKYLYIKKIKKTNLGNLSFNTDTFGFGDFPKKIKRKKRKKKNKEK